MFMYCIRDHALRMQNHMIRWMLHRHIYNLDLDKVIISKIRMLYADDLFLVSSTCSFVRHIQRFHTASDCGPRHRSFQLITLLLMNRGCLDQQFDFIVNIILFMFRSHRLRIDTATLASSICMLTYLHPSLEKLATEIPEILCKPNFTFVIKSHILSVFMSHS
jgi:hypothetical protein